MIQERFVLCARRVAWAISAALICAGSPLAAQEFEVKTVDGGVVATQTDTPQAVPQAAPATPTQPPTDGSTQPMPMPMPGTPAPGTPMPMPGAPMGTTTRPNAPTAAINPEELKVEPDADGKIQFSFNGQPWPDVLEWFARISDRTLDWQELPADYLNLSLNRPYTLEEARDLLNRHLLARGFTFLEHEEGFSVIKIDKINPALVPRISAADLDKRMPHEFVKVSFKLKWLMADELVKELEPLKSPNGKLVALSSTNRIEAMDAVVNLLEIRTVLGEEQSDEGRNELVREFPLHYVKAVDVQKQLETFLGMESSASSTAGMSPEQIAMQQQMQAQMAAQAAQMAAANPGAAAPTTRKVEMRLVADSLRNRIIAHGPPDKIALVESFIRVADVPTGGAQSLEAMLSRVRVYRLASLDPDQFVQSLTELGGLDPMTRVRPDPKNNAIIVDGSLVDQYTIKSLIERLDGSGRRFEVIPLRRHSAEEVAGSIELLMGSDEDDDSSNSRRGYYSWDYFGYGYGGNREERKKDKFRVGANVEYNQLLLWANDIELEEVRKLLVKLGEISDPAGGGRVRTIEVPRGQSPADVLERLKEIWPSISPNPLELPSSESLKKEPVEEEESDQEQPATETLHDAQQPLPRIPADLITQTFVAAALPEDSAIAPEGNGPSAASAPAKDIESPVEATQQTRNPPESGTIGNPPERRGNPTPTEEDLLLEEAIRRDREQRADADEQRGPANPPPIKITVGPDGNLVISSQDTEALNLLQQLLEDNIPRPRSYHVFRLKYTDPLFVKFNLEDFFKEDKSDEDDFYRRWWYGESEQSDDRRQLGKSKKLKFIDDRDTNTIVVVGADDEQLETIAELIKLYDVPEQVNSQNTRVTKLFPVRYSKASAIAATLKDTFIDLLSSNDKALQGQGQQNERPTATVIRNYGPPAPGGNQQQEKRTQISFKGKLAIGVDEITNTLIVSAEGESLLNIVGEIIEQLDRAAMPEAHVEVVPFAGNGNYDRLQKALNAMLTVEQPQAAQQGQPPMPQGQQQPGQPAPQPQQQPIIIED